MITTISRQLEEQVMTTLAHLHGLAHLLPTWTIGESIRFMTRNGIGIGPTVGFLPMSCLPLPNESEIITRTLLRLWGGIVLHNTSQEG